MNAQPVKMASQRLQCARDLVPNGGCRGPRGSGPPQTGHRNHVWRANWPRKKTAKRVIAAAILEGFDDYREHFRQITNGARVRFEKAQWQEIQQAAAERTQLGHGGGQRIAGAGARRIAHSEQNILGGHGHAGAGADGQVLSHGGQALGV